jgi:hypothetical protein
MRGYDVLDGSKHDEKSTNVLLNSHVFICIIIVVMVLPPAAHR